MAEARLPGSRHRSGRLGLWHDTEYRPAMRAVKKDHVGRPLAGHLDSLRDAGDDRLLAIDLINSVAAPRAREELCHRATVISASATARRRPFEAWGRNFGRRISHRPDFSIGHLVADKQEVDDVLAA
jgi:hypothetical protein